MRRSHVVVPVHFVWSTYQRLPLILPDYEDALYTCIADSVIKAGCEIIAVGGMPDHLHLACLVPATVRLQDVMQQAKGVSSRFMKAKVQSPEKLFYWEDNYSAYGFHVSLAKQAAGYIRRQKRHHAEHKVWAVLEEIGQDVHPELRITQVKEESASYDREEPLDDNPFV